VYCHDLSPVATQHSLVAVACGESRVHLLDLKSGSTTHMLRGHEKSVLCVRWSPRQQFLLATGGYGTFFFVQISFLIYSQFSLKPITHFADGCNL